MSTPPRIGIVTISGDLHAEAIRNRISQLDQAVEVHIFYIDKPEHFFGGILVSSENETAGTMKNSVGRFIALNSLSVIWWRRTRITKVLPVEYSDFIAKESQDFIEGAFRTCVRGAFVNHPDAAIRASNKIIQMSTARKLGLRTADTIYTCNPEEIERFIEKHERVIVKAISGRHGKSLLTQMVTPEMLKEIASLSACPACYQEFIDGNRHIRIVLAGRYWDAVEMLTESVDSRTGYMSESVKTDIPAAVVVKLQEYLSALGLTMGVIDMKVGGCGEYFFLEVNQQGQFVHLDAISGTDCVGVVSRCLIDEVVKSNNSLQARRP